MLTNFMMFVKICLFALLSVLDFVYSEDPLVVLPSGQILGRTATTEAGTQYYAFQKIPYAAPPVGSLRFQAPQPVQNWEGTLNTTLLDVSCYQINSNTETDSEDCLFINVFTPQLPSDDGTLYPVMFYIHGGAFIQGSSIYMPPDLYVDNDVILVTINYRLGPFGFLSTEDEVIPGNNGLKDQKFAIQWTYDNIHLFSGNKSLITVFGTSAGSASVSYQLLNKDLDGLIKGAIMESGTFLCSWSLQREPRNIAFATGAVLNSTFNDNTDSKSLLDFLLTVNEKDLDAASEEISKNVTTPWFFDAGKGNVYAPVIEAKNPDAFFTNKMYGLLKAGNILAVPTVVGFNSEESLLFNQDPKAFQKNVATAFDNDLNLLVPDDMQLTDPQQHEQMGEDIRQFYTQGEPFSDHPGAAIRLSSDTSFTRPIIKYSELFSSLADTYLYQFSYDGPSGNINVHYEDAESVGHAEECSYLFCSGSSCNYKDVPENDKLTSERLIKLWTDFAKFQNPTPDSVELLQNVTWPKFDASNNQFVYLDINENLEVKEHPKQATYDEWIKLYTSLNFDDFDTY